MSWFKPVTVLRLLTKWILTTEFKVGMGKKILGSGGQFSSPEHLWAYKLSITAQGVPTNLFKRLVPAVRAAKHTDTQMGLVERREGQKLPWSYSSYVKYFVFESNVYFWINICINHNQKYAMSE